MVVVVVVVVVAVVGSGGGGCVVVNGVGLRAGVGATCQHTSPSNKADH